LVGIADVEEGTVFGDGATGTRDALCFDLLRQFLVEKGVLFIFFFDECDQLVTDGEIRSFILKKSF